MTPEDIDRLIAVHDRWRARNQRVLIFVGLAAACACVLLILYAVA